MAVIVDTVHTHTHTHTHTHKDSLNENKKARQTNIELLRIVCIILIIMHHYALYSGFEFQENIELNKIIVQILTIGGKIGANVFFIITGYFTINSEFQVKKLINIVMQTLTYSMIFLIFNFKGATLKQIVKSIFPIIHSQYWFITVYVILYLLSPYINQFIKNISKKDLGKLLIMLMVIQSIIPSVLFANFQFSTIMWSIMLYMIGAYINKYYSKKENSLKTDMICIIVPYLLIIASIVLLDVVSGKINIFKEHELYFTNINSILILAISIFMFLLFNNINIRQNKFINKISSTVFGIYIIHENTFMRKIIWENICNGRKYINSTSGLILNAFISIIMVFVVCSIIELIRQWIAKLIQCMIMNKVLKKE